MTEFLMIVLFAMIMVLWMVVGWLEEYEKDLKDRDVP